MITAAMGAHLLEAYARAAECQLATYESVCMLKRSSKSETARHRGLCVSMLDELTHVQANSGDDFMRMISRGNPRVREFLSQELTADVWLRERDSR